MLEDKVHMLESEVASRNQVIGDIEVKFTDYIPKGLLSNGEL